jgi:hypothetical protein
MGNVVWTSIFSLICLSICLNFATGFMITLLPDIGNNPQYNPYVNSYDKDNAAFTSGMNKTIDPTPDSSNTFFRLIDSLNIGLISKLLNTINSYLFGFNNYMFAIFHVQDSIKILFNSMVSISYIFGAFALWTGKFN